MSNQLALDFLNKLRSDASLSKKISDLSIEEDLKSVLDIARLEGFDITEANLREAFTHEWAMRWFVHTKNMSFE